jgi:hypothetical protein
MFLFDWPKIYDASKGNVVEIVRIFRMIVEKQIPKNKYDPIFRYSQKDFSGISFMLHPDVLLYHSFKYKYREVAQYISLCALRSAADFISTQDPSLEMVLMPGLSPEKIIEDNRLLQIDEGRVYFRYEEVNPKEIH